MVKPQFLYSIAHGSIAQVSPPVSRRGHGMTSLFAGLGRPKDPWAAMKVNAPCVAKAVLALRRIFQGSAEFSVLYFKEQAKNATEFAGKPYKGVTS